MKRRDLTIRSADANGEMTATNAFSGVGSGNSRPDPDGSKIWVFWECLSCGRAARALIGLAPGRLFPSQPICEAVRSPTAAPEPVFRRFSSILRGNCSVEKGSLSWCIQAWREWRQDRAGLGMSFQVICGVIESLTAGRRICFQALGRRAVPFAHRSFSDRL